MKWPTIAPIFYYATLVGLFFIIVLPFGTDYLFFHYHIGGYDESSRGSLVVLLFIVGIPISAYVFGIIDDRIEKKQRGINSHRAKENNKAFRSKRDAYYDEDYH